MRASAGEFRTIRAKRALGHYSRHLLQAIRIRRVDVLFVKTGCYE
jgi:hypothetical protein